MSNVGCYNYIVSGYDGDYADHSVEFDSRKLHFLGAFLTVGMAERCVNEFCRDYESVICTIYDADKNVAVREDVYIYEWLCK